METKMPIKVEDVYPITTRVTPEGHKQVFITTQDLKDYTIPARYASLTKELSGQTSYIYGVYPHDVERWLNNKANLD